MAGVLRRDKFSSTPAFSFHDLENDAQALREQTRAEAQQIIEQAEAEARRRGEQIERDAHQRGLEEGRQQGLAQARAEGKKAALKEARQNTAQLAQALTAALQAVEADKRRLLGTAECGLLELALAIARRVCKRDAGVISAAVRDNARAVLEMVKHEVDLELHLNPADHALLHEATDFEQAMRHFEHVTVVADESVSRGGCLLRTRHGTIDASIDTQLDRIAEALAAQPESNNRGRVRPPEGSPTDR